MPSRTVSSKSHMYCRTASAVPWNHALLTGLWLAARTCHAHDTHEPGGKILHFRFDVDLHSRWQTAGPTTCAAKAASMASYNHALLTGSGRQPIHTRQQASGMK